MPRWTCQSKLPPRPLVLKVVPLLHFAPKIQSLPGLPSLLANLSIELPMLPSPPSPLRGTSVSTSPQRLPLLCFQPFTVLGTRLSLHIRCLSSSVSLIKAVMINSRTVDVHWNVSSLGTELNIDWHLPHRPGHLEPSLGHGKVWKAS